jgi:hypothetical protein
VLPLTSFEYQKKKSYGTQISKAEIPDFDYVLVKLMDMSLGRSVEVVVRVSEVFYLLLLLSQAFCTSVLWR